MVKVNRRSGLKRPILWKGTFRFTARESGSWLGSWRVQCILVVVGVLMHVSAASLPWTSLDGRSSFKQQIKRVEYPSAEWDSGN